MKIVTLTGKGLLSALGLSCCCLRDPGGVCRAQGIPTGAGSLDSSFFSARGAEPNWYGGPTVQRIAVQPDGSVVISGSFAMVQGFARQSLARVLPNGSLDRSFVPPGLLSAYNYVRDFVLEPGGNIVVAANASGLVRLDAIGIPDPGFDGQLTNGASAVVRLPGGEYLAATYVEPTNSAAGYGVILLDAQGRPSPRWTTDYRSARPVSFLLLSPDTRRLVVDGIAELSLDFSGANFSYLSNALPARFWPSCGAFQADGKLLLGRSGSSASEWNTNSTLPCALVRLNPDRTMDPTFRTNVSIGVGELEGGRDKLRIDAVAIQADGNILIGGFFTRVNDEPRPLLARVQPNGELDAGFEPDIEVNPGADIDALQALSAMGLAPDGRLIIGGIFTHINGLVCSSLARLHTTGETSGGILAFGQAVYYAWETNGPVRVSVRRFGPANHQVSVFYESPDLNSDIPVPGPQRGQLVFAPEETNKTITLPVQDNRMLDGNHSFRLRLSNPGGGAVLTGTPETRITIFDDEQPGRPGSVDLSFRQIHLEGAVYSTTLVAVEPDGSALLSVYSTIDMYSGLLNFMRCDPTGVIDESFHPSIDGTVTAAFPDPATARILIVGNFSTVNGQSRPNLARLNHDGSLDAGFPAAPIDRAEWINGALLEPDGKILIHGGFVSFNNVPRQHVVRLLADGTVDPQFDTSAAYWINGIEAVARQPDGKIVLAGSFTQGRGLLVRLNRDGSADASFVPPALRYQWGIQALLCQPDGRILLGGNLCLADGRTARLIRLNADGSLDNTFWTTIPLSYYGNSLLLQPDGKIIVGATWRFNPDGSRDYSFFTGESSDSVGTARLLPDGSLLVCGSFTTFAEWPRFQLVRLNGGDAPVLGFFDFAPNHVTVPESAGFAQVRIRRVGPTNDTAVVEYATSDGSARASLDYGAVWGSLTFAPGEEEKSLLIPIVNDSAYRGNRSFEVRLRDLTSGTRGLTTAAAFLDIIEDDPGLTFSRTNFWVYSGQIATNGTPWQLEFVQRHGDLSEPLTVQCQITAGTAIPGVDFIPTNVTVHFEPNNYEAAVLVPLLPNDQAVSDRTVLLSLTNASPDISLTTDSCAVLTILGPPVLPHFLPVQGTIDETGRFRWSCYLRPGQQCNIETSSNLIDWTSLTWIYLDQYAGLSPVFIEDPDAWKYPRRFYRLPVYQGPPD
jgi:uncharacterized delta-60 repeat protein